MDRKTGQLLEIWNNQKDNLYRATPVNLNEDPVLKKKRIADLETDPEKWKNYYFPNFCSSKPAPFHLAADKRILSNPEWYEILSWSRELAKTTRTMMNVLYLTLTGKKSNVLLVSNSSDNAVRLLAPYKKILELNDRIICDYGMQESIGNWEASEFLTRGNVSFRALGKGQSPRGTKKDEVRPDVILIDDFDTDEEVRNPDRVKESIKWVTDALIPTRSISVPLLVIVCGNIIAQYCAVTELSKYADHTDIVNIRDKNGVSSWASKNTEEHILRVESTTSWASFQREYMNNPINEGDVFKEMHWDNVPALKDCDAVLVYSDPATSNKDKGSASNKGAAVIGRKGFKYYIYKTWLDTMSNSKFIDCLFQAHLYIKFQGVDIFKIYIENNSLQDPFYEQVLYPLIRQKANETGIMIPITPDNRKKPEKFFRIEGTLEPINRLGNLILNIAEKNNPDMKRLESQFLGVSPKAKIMDGPDFVEGGVSILQRRSFDYMNEYRSGKISNRKY